MSKGSRFSEKAFSAFSAGFFFILVGCLFLATPNLLGSIIGFFKDLHIAQVPNMDVYAPAPAMPRRHTMVYRAFATFSLVWGIFQILVLALRLGFHSPLNKKAETFSSVVFWLAACFLTQVFLNEAATLTNWFLFWDAIIMLIGFSLVVRGLICGFNVYRTFRKG
ncbi:MAG: hypothetical protein QW717_04000 [Candidatus Bathyarchaeia archaeon]